MRILVTGAGGFIAHHLINRLKRDGHWVRGIDLREPVHERTRADEFDIRDLSDPIQCQLAVQGGFDAIYHLGAYVGGAGHSETHQAQIATTNVHIDSNMLQAASRVRARFLFSSSACVYPAWLQDRTATTRFRETDAWPADPEPGYGLEKLFAEKLCEYYANDYGLEARIVRLYNVYGPLTVYDGGKEKAPAALCRKVALYKPGDEPIVLWGDGKQTRSFCFVDDAVEGILRVMASNSRDPINVGSEELVTVTELLEAIISVSGKTVSYTVDRTKPQGVRGRNSDNSVLRAVTGWEPKTELRSGLRVTYDWVSSQVQAQKH